MAMIRLKHGGTFFGDIKDYDWKGKFLVVEIPEIEVNGNLDYKIIFWENVESVYDSEYEKEGKEKNE
jgi:hypothetical protein